MNPSSMLIVPGWLAALAGLVLAVALGGPAWCFLPTWLGVGLLALEACRHRPLRAPDLSGIALAAMLLAQFLIYHPDLVGQVRLALPGAAIADGVVKATGRRAVTVGRFGEQGSKATATIGFAGHDATVDVPAAWLAGHPIGTPVKVRYLADDPREALPEACPSSAGAMGVFAAVVPLVLLALGQLRRRRNRRHGHQRDFIDKLRKH